MKAAVAGRYGGPDVVTVAGRPTPVPGDGEVLVRVHAATVGVVDSLARRGAPAYARGHFRLRAAPIPGAGLRLRRADRGHRARGHPVRRGGRGVRHHRATIRRARGVCLPT